MSLCVLFRLCSEGVDLLSKFLQVSERLTGPHKQVFKLLTTSAEIGSGCDIVKVVLARAFMFTVDCFGTSV